MQPVPTNPGSKAVPSRSLLLLGAVLFTSAASSAHAADCKALIDGALDTPLQAGQELVFVVSGVHLAARNGGSFTSHALFPTPGAGEGADYFHVAPVAAPEGLYHRGEFMQMFPQRPSRPDRTLLEIRRGGRLTIRSITWGFAFDLNNMVCDPGTSGRIFVRALNSFPGFGQDSYNFILFPAVSGPIN